MATPTPPIPPPPPPIPPPPHVPPATRPPMPTTPPPVGPGSVANGGLAGGNSLQGAIDRLDRTMQRNATSTSTLMRLIASQATGGGTGNQPKWVPSNMGGSGGAGVSAAWAAAPIVGSAAVNSFGKMAEQTNNLRDISDQVARYESAQGPRKKGDWGSRVQTTAEQLVSSGLGYRLNGFGTGSMGQAGILYSRQFGGFVDNQPAKAQARSASGMLLANPDMSPESAARMSGQMATAQTWRAGQAMGIDTITPGRGTPADPTLVARQFYGRSSTVPLDKLTDAQRTAAFLPTSGFMTSFSDFGQRAGWDPTYAPALANQLKFASQVSGRSGGKVDEAGAIKLMNESAGDDQVARDAQAKLKEMGLGSDLGAIKDSAEGVKLGQEASGAGAGTRAAIQSAQTLKDIKTGLDPLFKTLAKAGGYWGGIKEGGVLGGTATVLSDIGNGLAKPWDWLIGKGVDLFGGSGNAPDATMGNKASSATPAISGLATGNVSAALSFATAQVGDRYSQSDRGGPDSWDCSSLMQGAYASIGVTIGSTTFDQINDGVEVPLDQIVPGDLLFYGDISHVGMFIGGGQVVQAANPSRGVVIDPVDRSGHWARARRILNSDGSAAVTNLGGGSKADKAEKPTTVVAGGGGGGNRFGSVEEGDILAGAASGGGGGGGSTWKPGGPPDGGDSTQNALAANSSATPAAPSNPSGNIALGKQIAASYGWTGADWDALYNLWQGESGWNSSADNPSSDAYGIPQAMSNLYPETATTQWRNSAEAQIRWGADYIKERYGTPSKAWNFWNSHDPHWYRDGAWEIPGDQSARLHAGEMVLDRAQAQTVRQALRGMPSGTSADAGPTTPTAVHLEFGTGSIVITMPSATAEGAKAAAGQFVSYVAADDRIKSLMSGW